MAAERDLGRLLSSMSPELSPGEYVFTVLADPAARSRLHPVATVHEPEGLTMVLPRHEADAAGLPYDFVAARIILRVHSDLAAVGLTAAVSGRLADAGISCNVVAGYHHDHLFVPADQANQALAELSRLSYTGPG